MPQRTLLRRIRTLALVLVLLGLAPVIADAILVSPHALFVTHEQRTSEIYLVNQGDAAEEVTVEFEFGYPATDSAGQISMRLIPDPPADAPSATGWLRAFPRQARVEPGQRQRVRIRANPPADLPDAEYWSRIIVTSHEAEQPMQVAGDTAVKAGITLQLRTITSLTYRKGAVSTGIRLDDFHVEPGADSAAAWVGLTRSGNGAFLGTVLLELRDADGNVVRSWATPVAVYYSVLRRFPLETGGIAPGPYTVRLLVSTDRRDIDQRYVLPAEPIERTVDVEID
jgi:P pilus assembly chaperone PapD